ncbi:MAG: hypothetical protein V7746_12335 [Halioglobus sp.]
MARFTAFRRTENNQTGQHRLAGFARQPQLLVFSIIATVSLLFLNDPLWHDLRLSHLLVVVLILCAGLKLWRQPGLRPEPMLLVLAALLLLATGLHIGLGRVTFSGMLSDAVKLGLLLLGTIALRILPVRYSMNFIQIFALLVPITLIWNYFFGNWAYYDSVRMRFGLESLGSPNSTAYVLSFSAIILAWMYENRKAGISGALLQISIACVVIAVVLTQSRGGAIILLVGLLALYGLNPKSLARMVFYAALGVVLLSVGPLGEGSGAGAGAGAGAGVATHEKLSRYNLVTEIPLTGGSGRLGIWFTLLRETLSDPASIIFGKGLGTIHLYQAESDKIMNSAHSLLISLTHWYGLLGVIVFAKILQMLIVSAVKSEDSLSRCLCMMLAVSFLLDGYFLDANTILINIFILCIALTNYPRRTNSDLD